MAVCHHASSGWWKVVVASSSVVNVPGEEMLLGMFIAVIVCGAGLLMALLVDNVCQVILLL